MSLGQESLTEKEKRVKKKEYPRKRHFRRADNKRFCTGRPKGKDELEDDWDDVDCEKCLIDKNNEDSGLVKKLRENLKIED